MALKISWSKKADARFYSIISYLVDEFGDVVASSFIKKVNDVLSNILLFPEIGSVENDELNIRGLVLTRHITLFYQVRKRKIILLNFYDNRQSPKMQRF
jgi:plasmid stabilization system protein ParE